MVIFLDESGDLGWSFGAPYRNGGSSRHLTISAVCIPQNAQYLLYRLVRDLYKKYGWDPKVEKKWTSLTLVEKQYFTKCALKLVENNQLVQYFSITVYKPRVQDHIKKDPNKLYNYLIRLLLLDEMARHNQVRFHPDPRNIKINSGNSLGDYLQTELFFTKNVATKLITIPRDSASNKGVQFADMLSGLIQHHYEDGNSINFEALKSHIKLQTFLFEELS